MNTIDATDARLSTHEAVCAQRYEKINESLDAGDWFVAFIAAASIVILTVWTARAVILVLG